MKLMTMRILVDLNRCQGYGRCVFLAPGVFELHGEEALMYDPGPDEEQLIPVVRAAAACPVQAIRVESPDSWMTRCRIGRIPRCAGLDTSGSRSTGSARRRCAAGGGSGAYDQ